MSSDKNQVLNVIRKMNEKNENKNKPRKKKLEQKQKGRRIQTQWQI